MINTTLLVIAATFTAGVVSVWVAALLSFKVLALKKQYLLSFAAGALLTTALVHVLPEALEGQTDLGKYFLTLLLGIVFFFILDKAELWHHGHEHSHHHHGCSSKHQGEDDAPKGGTWAVLMGDSLHCFGDGIMIATSFVSSMGLGLLATLAVFIHEIPHHMGDLAVVGQGGRGKRITIIKVSLAGAMTVAGGVIGYLLVSMLEQYLPYVMCITASSFIYVALADLIPQLQKHQNFKGTILQISWLLAGLILVYLASHMQGG